MWRCSYVVEASNIKANTKAEARGGKAIKAKKFGPKAKDGHNWTEPKENLLKTMFQRKMRLFGYTC